MFSNYNDENQWELNSARRSVSFSSVAPGSENILPAMTIDTPSMKKEHHHHHGKGGHHHHHLPPKPGTGTTEDSQKTDSVAAEAATMANYATEELKALREELEIETKMKNQAQSRYTELNQQVQELNFDSENFKNNPESKYDSLIVKQNCVNDALNNQVHAAREKLTKLSQSLKNIDVCGKGNKEDAELTKEIKRLERMQIDLRSNLDRLQWRLDCEAKNYYHLLDSYQKLQVELYYLEHLSEKYAVRGIW